MGNMQGMDVAGVRELSKLMRSKADEIDAAQKQVTTKVNSVVWKGADAERYKSDWNGTYVGQLRQVVDALNKAAQQAQKDADEQEKASS